MVRGAEFDNGVPQSDNPVEAGKTQAHGTGATDAPVNRANKTADLPDASSKTGGQHSASGAPGHTSGKGGHEPHTLGENKGRGAQGV